MSTTQFSDIEMLPSGGFNALARGWRYGQRWLLKGLKPEYASLKVYHDLLRKEFDIGALLHHPGIVGMVSLEQVPQVGGLCIVEEWVDGVTLTSWLQTPRSSNEKLRVLAELLRALAYCHSMQVIHRDLKPSNVMITREGSHVKLIDFGLSDTDNYDIFKTPAGTLRYVAPEQKSGRGRIDARADLYSVGCIMADMKLPRRFNRIIKQCQQPDPALRPASAEAMLREIERVNHRPAQRLKVAVALVTAAVIALAAWLAGGTLPERFKPTVSIAGYDQPDTTRYDLDSTYYGLLVPSLNLKVYFPGLMNGVTPGPVSESVAVDLGLSVKWAPMNVGAKQCSMTMPGGFYRYGVTTEHDTIINYDTAQEHYPNSPIAGTSRDVAHVCWGGRWRMPTLAQWQELLNKCQLQYVANDGQLPGYLVTGPNGNQIFLPFCGFSWSDHYCATGEAGYYWASATGHEAKDAGSPFVKISPTNVDVSYNNCLNAFSVRAVVGN